MKFILSFAIILTFNSYANNCENDLKKYCPNITPGRGQVFKCLEPFSAELTKACAKEISDFKIKMAKENPCFSEMVDFCSELPSDPVISELCLLKNEQRLGASCLKAFRPKKTSLLAKWPCATETVNRCYDTLSAPEGATIRCLIKSRPQLNSSIACAKFVDNTIASFRKSNPCFDETEKFCPKQIRFIEIQDCLYSKVASLKKDCQMLVLAESNKMKGNPCYRDLLTHCRPRLNPSQQENCLSLNEEHLSKQCKEFRVSKSTKLNNMVTICEKDRLKFCAKAPFENGQVLKCLRGFKDKISPDCKKLL